MKQDGVEGILNQWRKTKTAHTTVEDSYIILRILDSVA
jgi:hypothetical protein